MCGARFSLSRLPALLALLVVGCGGPVAVCAQTFYVDRLHPLASDGNPGTEEAPWATIQHAADTLSAGQTVLVKTGTYPEQVVPSVSGSAGAEIAFAAFPGATVTVDGAALDLPAWTGLVYIVSRSYLRWSAIHVANAHGAAADPLRGTVNGFTVEGSSHVTIEKSLVSDTAGSGILVWSSSDVLVDGNEITRAMRAGADSRNEHLTVGGSTRFEVRNNLVYDDGVVRGEGIDVKDGSSLGSVHHNHVHHVPGVGIYVDAWDKSTGSIDLHGNLIHEVDGNGIVVASEQGGLLQHVRIFNNVVWGNRWVGIDVSSCCAASHPINDVQIVNNTVVGNGWASLPNWGGGIGNGNPQATQVVIRNNLVSENLSFQIALEGGSATVDHNLIDGFRDYPDETRGLDYREGTPGFVDAAGRNFHLLAGALAVDGGSLALAPAVDLEGNSRASGTAPDMGAYEFQVLIFSDGFESGSLARWTAP